MVGFVILALKGIAVRFELQRTAVPALLQIDFANIKKNAQGNLVSLLESAVNDEPYNQVPG
jgi:hypothetical protein